MDGYSISQVAERTGFAPSTLRFYEQSGLVRPDRTPSGYRSYDDTQPAQPFDDEVVFRSPRDTSATPVIGALVGRAL